MSISERGFTYLEMVIALAILTTLFPFVFSIFYTIYTDVTKQLLEHRLYDQYDQFQTQLMRDAANGTTFIGRGNQLIMTMKNGEQVQYTNAQGQIVRSIRPREANLFQGHTILLYHVSKIMFTKQGKGLQMTVNMVDRQASFIGNSYIWGRVDG